MTRRRSSEASSKKCWREGGENAGAAIAALAICWTWADARRHRPWTHSAKRAQVLSALLEQLRGLARRGPLLMVFEDVQWSDPTTLELLSRTVEQMQALPVLLIITFRPDFQPPWAGQPHVTTMTLNRLGRRERMAIGRSTSPAARRCRRRCSSRSSSVPTACRCSSRS